MRDLRRAILVLTLLVAPMLVSFAQDKPAEQKATQPILKLAVMADGRISVN